MNRSRRCVDPYLCSRWARLRWALSAPSMLVGYAVVTFLALSLGLGLLLGSGPLQQRVEVPVPGPTVTVTVPADPGDS